MSSQMLRINSKLRKNREKNRNWKNKTFCFDGCFESSEIQITSKQNCVLWFRSHLGTLTKVLQISAQYRVLPFIAAFVTAFGIPCKKPRCCSTFFGRSTDKQFVWTRRKPNEQTHSINADKKIRSHGVRNHSKSNQILYNFYRFFDKN